jgi:hypothetical protein
MSKNITIEAIEQSGYKVYAGTDEFPEGRVWAGGKWAASIKYNGKKIHLGLFDSEIDAAKTYDNEATKLFGEYINLNFTEKGEV